MKSGELRSSHVRGSTTARFVRHSVLTGETKHVQHAAAAVYRLTPDLSCIMLAPGATSASIDYLRDFCTG